MLHSTASHPKPGTYKHYKGALYEVIGMARHSETLEEMVVYRALYDSADFGDRVLWVRPLTMFVEDIEYEGDMVPRFMFVDSHTS